MRNRLRPFDDKWTCACRPQVLGPRAQALVQDMARPALRQAQLLKGLGKTDGLEDIGAAIYATAMTGPAWVLRALANAVIANGGAERGAVGGGAAVNAVAWAHAVLALLDGVGDNETVCVM